MPRPNPTLELKQRILLYHKQGTSIQEIAFTVKKPTWYVLEVTNSKK